MVVTRGGSDTGPAAEGEPTPIAFPPLGERPGSEGTPALGEPSEGIGDWREELCNKALVDPTPVLPWR